MRLHVRDLNVIETETREPRIVRIEVSYSKGGRNFITGGSYPRGYYLDMQPLQDKGDGCVSFVLGSGVSSLIETATRLNRKRLEQLRGMAVQFPESEGYRKTLASVFMKGGLEIVTAEPPAEQVADGQCDLAFSGPVS